MTSGPVTRCSHAKTSSYRPTNYIWDFNFSFFSWDHLESDKKNKRVEEMMRGFFPQISPEREENKKEKIMILLLMVIQEDGVDTRHADK